MNFKNWGFPCGSAGKESTCNVGDLGSIAGLGRSPGEGKVYSFQYSGLENFMDSPWGCKESDTTEWLSLSQLPFIEYLPSVMYYITRTLLIYLYLTTSTPEGTAPSVLQGQELLQRNGVIAQDQALQGKHSQAGGLVLTPHLVLLDKTGISTVVFHDTYNSCFLLQNVS